MKRVIFVTLDFDAGSVADPDLEGTVEFIAGSLTVSLEGMAHGFNRKSAELGTGARLAVDVSLDHDDGVEARTIELLAEDKSRPWASLPRELRIKEARRAAGVRDADASSLTKAPERVGLLPRTALRIPVEGEPELIDLESNGSASRNVRLLVQELIDGYFALVALPDDDGLRMLVDEDAEAKKKPTNVRATLLARQTVRGDVIVVRESIGVPVQWVSLRDDDVPLLTRFKFAPEVRS